LRAVLADSRDARERAVAENLMGYLAWREGRVAEALPWYRRSAASPDPLMAGYAADDVAGALNLLGRGRESTAFRERALRLFKQVRTPLGRQWAAIEQAFVYGHKSDFRRALDTLRPFVGVQVAGAWTEWRAPYGEYLGWLHEISAARGYVQAAYPPVELAAEDWPRVLQATGGGSDPPAYPLQGATKTLALTELGRLDEAAALAATLPQDCNACVAVHGLIAGRRGDVATSEHLLAQAVRMAPHETYIRLRWGRERLRRGDTDGAIVLFEETTRVAPRYADGYAWWGEALLAKGQAKAAAAKFAQAARFAPRWGRLHLKWGEALASLRRTDEARARWRVAASMDLTPAERARVTALLAGASA
jgi:tetratricopeptide (TPR) repeat protein